MIGRVVDSAIVVGFAVAGFAVLLATAISTGYAGLDAGIGSLDDDILTATLAVGTLQMLLVLTRLRDERWTSSNRARVVIASLDGLVALALAASVLLLAILLWFPDEHATLASRGYPVTVLWAGIQLVAVLLSQVTARFFVRWLNPTPTRERQMDGGAEGARGQTLAATSGEEGPLQELRASAMPPRRAPTVMRRRPRRSR